MADVRAELLRIAPDRRPVTIDVNGQSLTVYVREPTALEVHLAYSRYERDATRAASYLLTMCVEDEDGKRVFSEADVDAVARFPHHVWQRLFDGLRVFLLPQIPGSGIDLSVSSSTDSQSG